MSRGERAAKPGMKPKGRKQKPVSFSDGFIKSFAAPFFEHYGKDSLFVRTVSDLWTSAYARMLIDLGEITDATPVPLFSDPDALAVISDLVQVEALKMPLLQEPMGFAPIGTIESSFNGAFGAGSFERWLSAFEERKFDLCEKITRRPV